MPNSTFSAAFFCSLAGALLASPALAQVVGSESDPCLVQPATDPPPTSDGSATAAAEQATSQFVAPAAKASEASPPAPPPAPPAALLPPPTSGATNGIRVVINTSSTADALQGLRVVEGAPYCADATSEYVKTLSDGNRITKLSNTRLCRDEKGRTRQEVGSGANRRIFINDPVAKASWVLNPNAKTFSRVGTASRGDSRTDSRTDSGISPSGLSMFASNGFTSGVFAAGTTHVQYVATGQPNAAQASEPASIAADARQRVLEWARDFSDRVRSGRSGQEVPALLQVNAINLHPDALSTLGNSDRGAGVVSPLSTRDIDGVRANGQLTTWTIEAGKVGNEKPIRITREVWTSPELMLTVRSKDVDPRDGENNYRLSNVVRSAPAPELFKVPSEFSEGKR